LANTALGEEIVTDRCIEADFTWYFFTQMGAGAYPSAATSMLSARFRYSGAGLGIAIGAAISGVLTTIFLPSFLGNPISGLNGLITVYAIVSVIAIISLLTIKKQGDITA
jgi:hypothetical protein